MESHSSGGQEDAGGDIHIEEGHCGSPDVGHDCQNFRRVLIGEYVAIRHPARDGVSEWWTRVTSPPPPPPAGQSRLMAA